MVIAGEGNNKLVIKDNPLFAPLISLLFVVVGAVLLQKPDLFVQSPPPILGKFYIIGGLVGLAMFSSYSRIIFDKPRGTLTIIRFGLIAPGVKSYPLSKITHIHWRLKSFGNPANRSGRLCLHFNDGTKIFLTTYRSSDPSRKTRDLGRKIAALLGVQYIQDEIKEKDSVFYD